MVEKSSEKKPIKKKKKPISRLHPRKGVPDELTRASHGVRIQKVLAEAGVASRRDAEELILDGRVRVNNQIVKALPAWVNPETDKIAVDGRPLLLGKDRLENSHKKFYILLNKPKRVITTLSDPQGRKTIMDLVKFDGCPRLFPVGRLDYDSTGALLLTNDGELTEQLTHPRYGVPKEYEVSVRGRLTERDIAQLKKGLFLTKHKIDREQEYSSHKLNKSETVAWNSDATKRVAIPVKRASIGNVEILGYGRGSTGDRTRLSVVLHEGQNREIRRLLARLGFKVRRLERIAIGPLSIKGLAEGQWRMLTGREVTMLQRVASKAVARQKAGLAPKGKAPTASERKRYASLTDVARNNPTEQATKTTTRPTSTNTAKPTRSRRMADHHAPEYVTKSSHTRNVTTGDSASDMDKPTRSRRVADRHAPEYVTKSSHTRNVTTGDSASDMDKPTRSRRVIKKAITPKKKPSKPARKATTGRKSTRALNSPDAMRSKDKQTKRRFHK